MHEDGVVPEYECRVAADAGHLNWAAFMDLSWQEKAKVVAKKRVDSLIEQHHLADASLGL